MFRWVETMRRISRFYVATAAVLAGLSIASVVLADPLHKFAKQDAYWHHGSGWVYPRTVAGLELQGSPTQLDGNEDVTGDYMTEQGGARRMAIVDVYYPTSAAVGAKLESAKLAVEAHANANKKACEASQSEAKFVLDRHPEIVGVKVTFEPKVAAGCSQADLYFFRAPDWVVTVRSTVAATDGAGPKALDEFVRALRWDTLGTDPFLHDASP